jgi:hypothetical protein
MASDVTRAGTVRGTAGLIEALGQRAITEEQRKLQRLREMRRRRDVVDSLVLGGMFVGF